MTLHRIAPLLLLTALLACGGGSTPTPPPVATAFAYADPAPSATAYRLVRNTTATPVPGRIFLDLKGPTSGQASGVVLTLKVENAKATWASLGTGRVLNGTVFKANGQGEPIVKATLNGDTLQVLVTERGTSAPKALDGVLLTVALDLKAGQAPDTPIAVQVDKARSQVLDGTTRPLPDVQIGALKLVP